MTTKNYEDFCLKDKRKELLKRLMKEYPNKILWSQVFEIIEHDDKELIKRLKNEIEQMKRDVIVKNINDEEVDFWMDKLETPIIKLIDKLTGFENGN